MSKVLERVIIGESRHYFIYGENGEKRRQLLKSIADKHPIILNESTPVGVYMEDFSLPIVTNTVEWFDKSKLPTFGREYLSFCIAQQLVLQFSRQVDVHKVHERIKKLLQQINISLKSHEYNDIQDLEDLIRVLKISKEFYKEEYKNLLQLGAIVEDINDLPIPFMTLNVFMAMFKKMVNTKCHFSLIFDQQTPIPLISQQAINGIITRRINSDISINVICNQNEWKTYYDLSEMLAEATHDYGNRNLEDVAPGFQKLK